MKKRNSGITLVALVITIIVLIILAGVSINAVMNDGLITNAKNASGKFDKGKEVEQLLLSSLEGIVEVENLEEVKAGEATKVENCKYLEGGKTAVIPAGFTVSKIAGEDTISGGLVIYSMDEATAKKVDWTTGKDESGNIIQETYNQYVWIPVDNPSDMYGVLESEVEGIDKIKFGKLYFGDYNTTLKSWVSNAKPNSHYNWPIEENYSSIRPREPIYLANATYADDSDYNKDEEGNKIITKDGIEKEFSDMIASVEKYKGFYIGRYELTGASYTNPTILKGAYPMEHVNWYEFYQACANLEKMEDGSINDKVRTTMIWGCQWDQTIKKCLEIDSLYLTTNATKYGNYKDSIGFTYTKKDGTTGTKTESGDIGKIVSGCLSSIYNIYDMGGNMYDQTMEAALNSGQPNRISRGGNSAQLTAGSSFHGAAANRTADGLPHYMQLYGVGCRAQLYIK